MSIDFTFFFRLRENVHNDGDKRRSRSKYQIDSGTPSGMRRTNHRGLYYVCLFITKQWGICSVRVEAHNNWPFRWGTNNWSLLMSLKLMSSLLQISKASWKRVNDFSMSDIWVILTCAIKKGGKRELWTLVSCWNRFSHWDPYMTETNTFHVEVALRIDWDCLTLNT